MHTDHEELAEGDVGEDIVGLVRATGEAGLLPELHELLEQRPSGSQVQHILSGEMVVQEGVIHVGEEPGDGHSGSECRGRGGGNTTAYVQQRAAPL